MHNQVPVRDPEGELGVIVGFLAHKEMQSLHQVLEEAGKRGCDQDQ